MHISRFEFIAAILLAGACAAYMTWDVHERVALVRATDSNRSAPVPLVFCLDAEQPIPSLSITPAWARKATVVPMTARIDAAPGLGVPTAYWCTSVQELSAGQYGLRIVRRHLATAPAPFIEVFVRDADGTAPLLARIRLADDALSYEIELTWNTFGIAVIDRGAANRGLSMLYNPGT